jgi:hypothetical protein
MKNIILLLFSFLLTGLSPLLAQREPVLPITQETRAHDWYVKQASLWKQALVENPMDAPAWLNYYTASRAALQTKSGTGDAPDFQKGLSKIVEEMGAAIPKSFEYNYVVWWNSGNDPEKASFLREAYRLQPDNPRIFSDMVTWNEVRLDRTQRKVINQKWYESNDMDPALLFYNYNVLMSVDKDAILITNGDNDTYPLWILQDALGVRKDVMVINQSLILLDDYRTEIFGDFKIKSFTTTFNSAGSVPAFREALFDHIRKNSERPFYYALTVSKEDLKPVEDYLYITGLASLYSKKEPDNIRLLAKNFRERFMLDYLLLDVPYRAPEKSHTMMNLNYLPSMKLLFDHYKASGKDPFAKKISSLAKKIGKDAGREDEVSGMFSK